MTSDVLRRKLDVDAWLDDVRPGSSTPPWTAPTGTPAAVSEHAEVETYQRLADSKVGRRIDELINAGGRCADEPCLRDGTPVQRIEIAGRTIFPFLEHQR